MGNQYSKCDDCYKTHLPEAHDGIIVLPSEAFSEGYVPEFNKASEDELEQHLLNDKAFQHTLKFAPESQRELMTFELARYTNALIRTEKLKLLDEVIHQSTVNLKSAKAVAGWAELRKKQLEANQ